MHCVECGGNTPSNSDFCGHCGIKIEVQEIVTISEPQRSEIHATMNDSPEFSEKKGTLWLKLVIAQNILTIVILMGGAMLLSLFMSPIALIFAALAIFMGWIVVGLKKFNRSRMKFLLILLIILIVGTGGDFDIIWYIFLWGAPQFYVLYFEGSTVKLFE